MRTQSLTYFLFFFNKIQVLVFMYVVTQINLCIKTKLYIMDNIQSDAKHKIK